MSVCFQLLPRLFAGLDEGVSWCLHGESIGEPEDACEDRGRCARVGRRLFYVPPKSASPWVTPGTSRWEPACRAVDVDGCHTSTWKAPVHWLGQP